MSKRNSFTGLALMALAAGCSDPQIMPVAPPGMELTRSIPTPEGGGAQALGEQAAAVAAQAKAAPTSNVVSPATPIGKPTTTPTGLTYETLKEGAGPELKPGQMAEIHYTGTLNDGTVFDSSRTKGTPFKTAIGVGQVIAGWDQGVAGMKVGERRKLVIPPNLGYGSRPQGPIPANSTLTFDVELLGIQ